MKSRRSKACDIPAKVKKLVWERDKESCILCGRRNAMPNAHYISRVHGGLGIEQNIVTLCHNCHFSYDNSTRRKEIGEYIETYLKTKYPDWDKSKLTYKKGETL